MYDVTKMHFLYIFRALFTSLSTPPATLIRFTPASADVETEKHEY